MAAVAAAVKAFARRELGHEQGLFWVTRLILTIWHDVLSFGLVAQVERALTAMPQRW